MNEIIELKKPETIKLGKLEIDLDELAKFIVKGKKHGYAGGGKYRKLKDGSKIFTFQEEDFYYEDRYWGSTQAPGRELVKWKDEKGQAIWFMSYSGGMLSKYWGDEILSKKVFGFLQEMLLLVTPEKPFRGFEDSGRLSRNRDMKYFVSTNGKINNFNGKEIVLGRDGNGIMAKELFAQTYQGCLIK